MQEELTNVLFEFEKEHNVFITNYQRVWLLDRLLRIINAAQQSFAADVCPDCKGNGIVKDGFGQLFECYRCRGSGYKA